MFKIEQVAVEFAVVQLLAGVCPRGQSSSDVWYTPDENQVETLCTVPCEFLPLQHHGSFRLL